MMISKFAAAVVSALLAFAPMAVLAAPSGLGSDKRYEYELPKDSPLGTVLTTILRAAGKRPIIDPALDGTLLSQTIQGASIHQIIGNLERNEHLQFETVGSDTVYVSASIEPDPPVTAAAAIAESHPTQRTNDQPVPPAKPLSLDEALGIANGAQVAMGPIAPSPMIPATVTYTQSAPSQGSSETAPAAIPQQPTPQPTSQRGNTPFALQGGLEHTERVTPVNPTLRAGSTVDFGKLHALTPGNVWSRIPNWAGGTWSTSSNTAYYHYNYEHNLKSLHVDTFMDKSAETFGWQKDKNGDIWHFVGTDFYTVSEGARDYSVDFHKVHEILEQSEDRFVVHHLATRALVAKTTKRVTRVYQAESINVYTRGKNGTLRCKNSIKSFDAQGYAASLQKGVSYEKQLRGFQSWDVYQKRDMYKLFAEYLNTHGMPDLIPAQTVRKATAEATQGRPTPHVRAIVGFPTPAPMPKPPAPQPPPRPVVHQPACVPSRDEL